MTTLVHDRIAIASPAVKQGPGAIERLKRTLSLWGQRIEERQALAQFGWREMKDVAITETDIAREIAKPFWRA
jgi:uncharacterized protein YjiS (DUF1127 family)